MEEKLITIVVLPYAKAHNLKEMLKAENIDSELESVEMVESASSSTMRVKILDKDLERALPLLEDLLGVKPFVDEQEPDKKEPHILVPVDFSRHSEKACTMAVNIASQLNVKLVFMHCYINPVIHSIPFSDIYAYDSSLLVKLEYSEEHANDELRKFVAKMAAQIGEEKWKSVSPEYIIKSGYPEDDILAFVQKQHPQLVVMGSGTNDAGSGTLGSIAVEVMYNSPVPVLIVPEEAPEKSLLQFNKVLYATNFDEKDFIAIDKLMQLLQPFDLQLKCVHVGSPTRDEWDRARLEGMKNVLSEKYNDKEFDCQLIEGDDILKSIDQIIKAENVDILSLTTHKRNMITRLFNPSLARKMLFHARTPLLIFHG